MKLGIITDRPPIYNGGFSQRISRELELISQINEIELYMFNMISLKETIKRDTQKNIKKFYVKCKIIDYDEIFLLSSKLPISTNMYDNIYVNSIIKFVKKYEIDLLLCENLWCAYLGYLVHKKIGINYIFDYHGVVPEENEFDGYCEFGDKRYNYLKASEKCAIENAKTVICVSNSFKKYLINNFKIDCEKIKVIPCCIKKSDINFDLNIRNTIRTELGVVEKKIIIYAGSITKYQCIDEMIWLFSELLKQNKKYYFIFLSAYNNFENIKIIFDKYGISKSNYCLKSVDHDMVKNYYYAADYGIILRENHLLNNVASPTKIAEYLSTGLSIIATNCIGDICEVDTKKVLFDYEDIKCRNSKIINQIDEIDVSIDGRNENFIKSKFLLEHEYIWEAYKKIYVEVMMDENND